MVTLNRIYTRVGDGGDTRLATGESVRKCDLRVEAYGAVDECNAVVGLARLHTREQPILDAMLARIQNELFDLGADLATPERDQPLGWEPLRIVEAQVDRLEREIDRLNADLPPLESFVLPGGTDAATWLHMARTVCRRAERVAVDLTGRLDEKVSAPALKYMNRLSDFFFVASRWLNASAGGDVLWTPGSTRAVSGEDPR